jgi:uncharacterized protein YdaU (DUF1376 family)
MAKKDPAFLFYSEKWLQGTASLMPEEKGVYIDLLCHQHQDGSLPNDTRRLARMAGLSEAEFLPIWSTVREKFRLTDDNRWVNRKLTEVVTERLTKGLTNKIIGSFAAVVRLAKTDEETKQKIKQEFNWEDFKEIPTESLTERLTEWFNERLGVRLKSIITIDIDSKESIDKNASVSEEGIESTILKEVAERAQAVKDPKQFPVPNDFNGLPALELGKAKEYIRLTKNADITPEGISAIWELFKIKHLTGKKFYADDRAVYSHFLETLKFEKFDNPKKLNNAYTSRTSGTKPVPQINSAEQWGTL